MSETKWTPGPWREIKGEAFGANGQRVVIAGCGISTSLGVPGQGELANGALVLCAPDLFEALTAMRQKFHRALVIGGTDPEFADEACAQADAALAKASPAQTAEAREGERS